MTLAYHSRILANSTVIFCCFAGFVFFGFRRNWIIAGFLFGLCWASFHGQRLVENALPSNLNGVDFDVIGTITGIPKRTDNKLRFYFAVEKINDKRLAPANRLLSLAWYDPDVELQAGERWQLTVRLKQNRGFMNPGGFDYEKWLIGKGVSATGYVREREPNRRLQPGGGLSLDGLRQRLSTRLAGLDLPDQPLSLIRALAVGDGSAISAASWDLFRRTGTTHLLVISGLHITLVAGVGWWLAGFFWSHAARVTDIGLCRETFAGLVSMSMACLYAALAGFTVPTTRALIMLLVYFGYRLMRRHMTFMEPLSIALLLVLLLQPLSVMTAGFWLSFFAVGLIFYLQRLSPPGRFNPLHWFIWHGALSLGLAPMTLLFFSFASVLSVAANFIAVPLLTVLVVPLVLLGVLMLFIHPAVGQGVLQLSGLLLQWLLDFLDRLTALVVWQWWPAGAPGWSYALAVMAVALLFVPRGTGLNWLTLPLSAALLWPAQPVLREGEFALSVIDVGQGLSVLVETREHALLFDTGGRLSSRTSSADVAVIPYLRHLGLSKLDRLVISHPDTDHAAGLADIRDAISIDTVSTAKRFQGQIDAGEICDQQLQWRWNGVIFAFLNASANTFKKDNDHSCVLRVSSGQTSILLAGDIEQTAEQRLLEQGLQRTTLLVAPHHGSRTSSSAAFVETLAPAYVVYSVGYRNPYGFPHEDVRQRYAALGAQAYRTDRDGLLKFHFTALGLVGAPQSYRNAHREFWRSKFDLRLE
ncbi:MAG: DNA internalization-related competence protein ComEC/Rec2 [Gammaproteobacteria bacterium]|nr:DNA internalization-related competence protein ComEC/Rec2 [Gammaproteobacteria bacterium]